MATAPECPFGGRRAILPTKHGKEAIVAPLMGRFLGLAVSVTDAVDTDRFGTFSREVPRVGSATDAARAKIAAAFEAVPEASIAIASEGSFGPHPYIPFLPLEREIVVLSDRDHGIEIVGHNATPATNFAHAVVRDVASALEFARRAGFPDHGVIVMGCHEKKPDASLALVKDAASWVRLDDAVATVVKRCGAAFIESDMRAHRNPRRMRVIRRATTDLIRRALTPCPSCRTPGFGVTGLLGGLPCSACGGPTELTRAQILRCAHCEWRIERPLGCAFADPGQCPQCNP